MGLWGRSGIIPIAHSQDTAGPMARSLEDAVALLGALSAEDPNDPATRDRGGEVFSDYSQFLDAEGLRGARIGVARQFFGFHESVDRLLEEALEAMSSEGAELVDEIDLPRISDVSDLSYQVLLYEFKADLNAYLGRLGPTARVRSLEDLIRFNEENREREMPYFEQEIFEAAEEKGDLSSPEYLEALATCKRLAGPEGIDAVMDEHRLDAIFAQGIPYFGISIALRTEGKIRLGVVYDPCHEDLFQATSTTPATLNGEQIVVQQVSVGPEAWSSAVVGTDWPCSGERRKQAKAIVTSMLDQVSECNLMGSPVLGFCNVAAGRLHAYWHLDLKIWDIAAASLILERAGGVLTDAAGVTWLYSDGGYLASNEIIHNWTLNCIQAGLNLS